MSHLNPKPEIQGGNASLMRVTALLNVGAVTVAALYFGQELLVPLVLAGLLAFVLAPLARVLERVHVPHVPAVFLAVLLGFGVIGIISLIVGQQVSGLATHASEYQANIMAKWKSLLESNKFFAELARPLNEGGSTSTAALAEQFARPLLGPVTTAAVVLVFTLVILLYSEDLRDRFVRLVGRHDLHRTILAMNDAGHRLSRYFVSQLSVNAAFGVWIGVGLALLGLPSAVLLGLIAMLMRFVPFVGTFIALGAPVLLALAVAPGWTLAIMVLALFLVTEIVVSQVVEPLLYGHSTGISPVAVLVATSFWALLWGFVGLLIATPLTVCLVVIGRNVAALSFFDVLFGSESPLLPSETFYQRALEGRSIALIPAAKAHISLSSRADYYDHVALPGLVLAQLDHLGDTVDPDRIDPIHAQIHRLVEALAPPVPTPTGNAGAWQREGAILCFSARGDFDDLGAYMAAHALQDAGLGAVVAPNSVFDSARPDEAADVSHVRLCCLSAVEASTSLSTIHLFVKQTEARMPGVEPVVGLWGATKESALLTEIRAEGGAAHVILSISELVAYARAISVQAEDRVA